MRRWSVPGSVLISGEYRITDEGGIGVAAAGGARAVLSVDKSMPAGISGLWGIKGRSHWTPMDGDERSAADAVYRTIGRTIGRAVGRPNLPPEGAMVDTRDFFDGWGEKRGLGSSAASAVLTAFYFASHTAGDRLEDTGGNKRLAEWAVDAHRLFQNGRGSGYDVLTSLQGGAGVFTGGKRPRWKGIDWPRALCARLLRGSKAISSSNAVSAYRQWKAGAAGEAAAVIAEMDSLNAQLIRELETARDNPGAALFELIGALGRVGAALGDGAGVPARPRLPDFFQGGLTEGRSGAAAKCSGAGDELTLILHLPDGLTRSETAGIKEMEQRGDALELKVDAAGLRREEDG